MLGGAEGDIVVDGKGQFVKLQFTFAKPRNDGGDAKFTGAVRNSHRNYIL
jgi:hypothetical protein